MIAQLSNYSNECLDTEKVSWFLDFNVPVTAQVHSRKNTEKQIEAKTRERERERERVNWILTFRQPHMVNIERTWRNR